MESRAPLTLLLRLDGEDFLARCPMVVVVVGSPNSHHPLSPPGATRDVGQLRGPDLPHAPRQCWWSPLPHYLRWSCCFGEPRGIYTRSFTFFYCPPQVFPSLPLFCQSSHCYLYFLCGISFRGCPRSAPPLFRQRDGPVISLSLLPLLLLSSLSSTFSNFSISPVSYFFIH